MAQVTKSDARQMAIIIGATITNEAERMLLAARFAALLFVPGDAFRAEKTCEFAEQVERAADNPQDYTSSLPATESR
jgi:hypothetical protein